MTDRSRPRLLGAQSGGGNTATRLIQSQAVLVSGGPKFQAIALATPVKNGDYAVVILQGIGYSAECVVTGLGASWTQSDSPSGYFAENSDAGTLHEAICPDGGNTITIQTPSGGGATVAVLIYVFRRKVNAAQGAQSSKDAAVFDVPPPLDVPPITTTAPKQMLFATAVSESAAQTLAAGTAPAGRWAAPLQLTGLHDTAQAAATWRESDIAGEVNATNWLGGIRSAATLFLMPAPTS
jgi:hypothetical protein